MDFSFSSDQQLLKNSARAFLDEHCKPAAVRLLWDDPRGESDTMWKEMAQLGWLGLSLPEAYGGSGLGMVETAILPRGARPRRVSRSLLADRTGRRGRRGGGNRRSDESLARRDRNRRRARDLGAPRRGPRLGPRDDVGARREDAQGLGALRDKVLRPLGPRGQRAADSRACAGRADPVPRRSFGVGPHPLLSAGHGSRDALGADRHG